MAALPRQVEYALMALSDMHRANPGQLFAVRRLCEAHEVPFDVMSKTMQRLARAKILRAVKGVNGGYQIIRDLSVVTLYDLIEAIMGSVGAVACLREGKPCPLEHCCNVTDSMLVLDRKLKDVYRGTSVLELLAVHSRQQRN
ncbi:MAG: Rrf2 family transcriptional regulator [Verrucomicrobia bacterium]|nr:Rrf2 family transcriptional regulator [Verrucomicrobiota bacterium]